MQIYKINPPKLKLTLSAGGDLLPDTTYYVHGFVKSDLGGDVYGGVTSWRSDLHSITTDQVNKSVSIEWWFEANIVETNDLGDGNIEFVCDEPHWIYSGQKVIFDSVYLGDFVVTRIDYYRFSIQSSFLGDYLGICKFKDAPSWSRGIRFFLNRYNPVDQEFGFRNTEISASECCKFTHRYYDTAWKSGDVLISSQPPYQSSYNTSSYYTPFTKPFGESELFMQKHGVITVLGDESDISFTPKSLFDEYKKVGMENNFKSTDNIITVCGFINFPYATNKLTSINFVIYIGYLRIDSMTLEDSNVLMIYNAYKGKAVYNSDNTLLTSINSYIFDRIPNFTTVDNIMRLAANVGWSQVWMDAMNGAILINPTSGTNKCKLTYVNDNYVLENAWFKGFYVYPVYGSNALERSNYLMKNCRISNTGSYDIRVYLYGSVGFTQKLLNIDTDFADNRKRVYLYAPNFATGNMVYQFHRSGVIYIKDKFGKTISDANLTIESQFESTDYISNENGEIDFNIIEQELILVHGSTVSDMPEGFEISVSKDGYKEFLANYQLSKSLDGLNIIMNELDPMIYINHNLSGELDAEKQLEGEITKSVVKGEISNTILKAVISQEAIKTNIKQQDYDTKN